MSLGGGRVPWNQDKIEAVSPCCFDGHHRNDSQHSVHLHCYMGISALWHHLFLFFTIVSDRNITLLLMGGSDFRIVAFRVDSGESVLSIHHGPMVTYECCYESKQ